MTNVDDSNEDDAVLGAARDILESASANSLIEIQFNKAVRVGTLLRLWREMMVASPGGDKVGMPFPSEWVDHAAMDIWRSFFPLPTEEEHDEPDDE